MNDRKVILYISMSIDGFISTKDDDLTWLSVVENQGKKMDRYVITRQQFRNNKREMTILHGSTNY
jgi:hypothetical protein